MKKLEIIIRPGVFDKVRQALADVGVNGMNYVDIRGFGRQRGHTEVYRGATVHIDFMPKVKIEVVVADEGLEQALDAVQKAARTGQIGDGKIFVSDVEDAVRIRTGERGVEAL